MKKIFILLVGLVISFQVSAQNCYWVFLTDKQNTAFDPYEYFDSKAIQRYQKNHQSLYDITNYPINRDYRNRVMTYAESYVGESRWLNAVAVMATAEQMDFIAKLPYVASIQLIETESTPARYDGLSETERYDGTLWQLAMMQGDKFVSAGYDGRGVRIAVLDAGFADVDNHPAFNRLRYNHQIVKTWDFTRKKEDIYNKQTHGREVLSCMAGIMNDSTLLGLATGAEYLLAITEINGEKKKEEVWWTMAMEWADKNGADIINSSVGYGMELYNTKDMDGRTAIVSKAANIAARKGMLVCSAMGNEGQLSGWKVMVAPADADSVLSIGAVLTPEEFSGYSSYGPTADGRMKPNVVACGKDLVASKNGNFDYKSGTSFACPLVTGFAACVLQMHPDWTVMQLIREIEKSANHYPYFDYAFGYGIPQAGYFTDETRPQPKEHTFAMYEDEKNIYIVPAAGNGKHKIFYNIRNGNGRLQKYDIANVYSEKSQDSIDVDANAGPQNVFSLRKSKLKNGQTLNVWYNGDYQKYVVGKDSLPHNDMIVTSSSLKNYDELDNDAPDPDFYNKRHRGIYNKQEMYFSLVTGAILPSAWNNGKNEWGGRQSRSLGIVIGSQWNLAKVYGLGLRLGFGSSWYAVRGNQPFNKPWSQNTPFIDESKTIKNNLKATKFDLEFYQRFKLIRFRSSSLYFDTGIYGSGYTACRAKYKAHQDHMSVLYRHRLREADNPLCNFDYGVRVRFGFSNMFAIYGQYRISSLLKKSSYENDLPRFEVGIELF